MKLSRTTATIVAATALLAMTGGTIALASSASAATDWAAGASSTSAPTVVASRKF